MTFQLMLVLVPVLVLVLLLLLLRRRLFHGVRITLIGLICIRRLLL